MLELRKAADRGAAFHGWLDTRHTFSFAHYYDPRHMGFRALRVINEDRVAPRAGFPTHGHQDMEIITYVLEGALAHEDSTGSKGVLRPGEVQRMSAGSGVRHSEYNASDAEALHLLQIWILPDEHGIEPSYEQRAFPLEERTDRFRLLVSPDGQDGSLRIHQDAKLYGAVLTPAARASLSLGEGRYGWVQVARGAVSLDGQRLAAGDGAALEGRNLTFEAEDDGAELLVFDLP